LVSAFAETPLRAWLSLGLMCSAACAGYNIIMAYNTMYRVGTRSHGIEVGHGSQGCDGDIATCTILSNLGGWGSLAGEEEVIPCAHVYIVNNVLYNPAGVQSLWQHFSIRGEAGLLTVHGYPCAHGPLQRSHTCLATPSAHVRTPMPAPPLYHPRSCYPQCR
jgi:hypothetical protein